MFKVLVSTAALVLLISSGAMGGTIIQNQGLDIHNTNLIDLLTGQQEGSSTQIVIVQLSQSESEHIASVNDTLFGITAHIGGTVPLSSLIGAGSGMLIGTALVPTTLNALTAQARLRSLMLLAH